MDRRSFLLGCGGCPLLPPRFTRPELESEEGGLWAYMDREERRLQRSPFLLRNEDLNTYIRAIAGRQGFLFEHTTVPRDGPALGGLAYGAVAGGKLYLMSYTAPKSYFYAKHLAAVRAIAACARLRIRETEVSASP